MKFRRALVQVIGERHSAIANQAASLVPTALHALERAMTSGPSDVAAKAALGVLQRCNIPLESALRTIEPIGDLFDQSIPEGGDGE